MTLSDYDCISSRQARLEVDDLLADLSDGRNLLKLLEIISGEKLGKPNSGKMRVHQIENVNKSLAFLHTKVRLESIGAEDIVDGNPRLILGLIWTIILRFQIQEIEIEVNEDDVSSEKKSAKDALLLWCQRRTSGHPNVNVQDFTGSWRSGMAFSALIHYHRPDVIDISSLDPEDHINNLNRAFDVAESQLGVPRLLDAEDVDTQRPDEKSIMTYVSSFYHVFAKMKNEKKGGRRIANIIGQLMDIDRMQHSYESFTSQLLQWISGQIAKLSDKNSANSLAEIQKEMAKFKEYRTIEKPAKYAERVEVEALLFGIQTKMKSLGQPLYQPPEGSLVQDIEKAWTELEKAEHKREVALREEILRLEQLESLAFRFERKRVLREGYLKEMIQVLSDPRYGSNLAQVGATVKKHEAICADIFAREERFKGLDSMAEELSQQNYHEKDRIQKEKEYINTKWNHVLGLLEQHTKNLTAASSLMDCMREVDTITCDIDDICKSLLIDETNAGILHLSAIQDLIQKHNLIESQISSRGETIEKLNKQSKNFLTHSDFSICKEAPLLESKLQKLNHSYASLTKLAAARKTKLEDLLVYYQFVEDSEEEEVWLVEHQRICQAVLPSKDLLGVIAFQQKHKALEAEIKGHKGRVDKLIEEGGRLVMAHHQFKADVEARLDVVRKQWGHLHELSALKRKQLEDAIEAFQYHHDANEAESWMKEKMQLATSEDCGKDEPSASALIQRHSRLEEEVNAYESDIRRLNDQSEKMIKSGIASLFMICGDAFSASTLSPEVEMEASEEWVEEVVEKEVIEEVTEEVHVPQVIVLYTFKGQQGMEVLKGDVLVLKEKTNDDWWCVHKSPGVCEGFVPANYVKQIEDRVAKVLVKRPVRVKQNVKRLISSPKKRSPKRNSKRRLSIICDAEDVEQRQRNITTTYDELVELCRIRRQLLENSVKLFQFNHECDNLENWIEEKERSMIETHEQHQQQLLERKDVQSVTTFSGPVETLRKKFECFLSDLSSNKSRIDEIDRLATEFTKILQPQYSEAVKQRQLQIHKKWDQLKQLRNDLGKKVEGLTCVDMFNRSCDDALDWMNEKMSKMEYSDALTRDLESIQAHQRKHENLERELAPIEEKLGKVNILADNVWSSFPSEKANVASRQKQLKDAWEVVKEKAIEKRNRLEEHLGIQVFINSSKQLLTWCRGYAKDALTQSDTSARDVATAELYLKTHEDLGFEIAAKHDDFVELEVLGSKILNQRPNDEVNELLNDLKKEKEELRQKWQEKDNWLKQCKDLMIFNQEADHLETMFKSHNTFLEFDDLGTTLDDVESLLKRHDNFSATLAAQEERLIVFSEMANKLIKAKHYNSIKIDARRQSILSIWTMVKEKATERKHLLQNALAFQQLKADADEFVAWSSDKIKVAQDDSYRDLSNIEEKLQKHEAFEAELNASQGRVTSLVSVGRDVKERTNVQPSQVDQLIFTATSKWEELVRKTKEKGIGIRQANAQIQYSRDLEDCRSKLTDLEHELSAIGPGRDLRSCKAAIKKHQLLELELSNLNLKLKEIIEQGKSLATSHFNPTSILEASNDVVTRLNDLSDPVQKRKSFLHEYLKFYQFDFELNTELQWINEHGTTTDSSDSAKNLTDALNMMKMHQKLEREVLGHQTQIDKMLAIGEALISQEHHCQGSVASRCKELKDAWKVLNEKVLEKRKRLEKLSKCQTFLSEANEIEAWISDKIDFLRQSDLGKDEDAAIKLLAKHKATELEVDTYVGFVSELDRHGKKLVGSLEESDAEVIRMKIDDINSLMTSLKLLLVDRCKKLIDSKSYQEYYRESYQFLEWVREQLVTAQSDDYGKDYEHLLVVQSKFKDFMLFVDSHLDRYTQLESFAIRLKSTDHAENAQKQWENVAASWKELNEVIIARDQKLIAAAQIHKFNRDVAEALSRIIEKQSIIAVDDVGRDLPSVQGLLRKHEGFENDLVALESQLQVLIDDSARLRNEYPGGNADHILKQQELVVQNWSNLQERVSLRKEHLQSSFALHKFVSAVKDLERWADGLGSEIGTQERVRDAFSVQELKTEHDRIKAEIETREPDFTAVVETGEKLTADESFLYREEVRSHLTRMLQCREALHTAWQLKKVYLDQLSDLHFFLGAAKQLDQLSSQQENYLASSDFGESVEDVSNFIKKHDAFEKLLASQEERLQGLLSSGSKLLEQNHFDSETIRKRMSEVSERRKKVSEGVRLRREKLQDAHLVAQFRRRLAEAEAWIDERVILLKAGAGADVLLRIQKHPALQAELAAHKKNVFRIIQMREELLTRKHVPQQLVRSLIKHLTSKLENYEHTLDAYIFQNEADLLEAWIESKAQVLKADNLGESVDEIELLLKQHEEFERIISAHEEKFSSLTRTTLLEKKILDEAEEKRKEEEEKEDERIRGEEERRRAQGMLQSKSTEDGTGFGFVRSLIGNKAGKGGKSKSELPPIVIEGFLERKHEYVSGGKRAGFRSWKGYYTVLCGQSLCFFRDKQSIHESFFVAAPISLSGAKCSRATDYTKKHHVFRLQLDDESEYLFAAQCEPTLQEWLEKIEYQAGLPPSAQNIPPNVDDRPEISAPINGSFVVGSVDSKRPPPSPPEGEQSPKNGRPPAPLPHELTGRGCPPLPPPRNVEPFPKSHSGHLDEVVRLRNGSNDSRDSIIRRSVPVAGNGDSGINSMPYKRNQAACVDGCDARDRMSALEVSRLPVHVPSLAPMSQVRVASTRMTSLPHPSQNDDQEWISHSNKHVAYAHTTAQCFVDPVHHPHDVSHDFSAQSPAQRVSSSGLSQVGDTMRPPSASSAEEELVSMNSHKTKKKGMISSLFKRNK